MIRWTALTLLVGAATPALAEWREATTDHFRVFADTDEATLGRFAEKLERLDGALRALRRVPREGTTLNKLIFYAVPDLATVQKLAGGASIGGWYEPGIDYSMAVAPLELGRTVQVGRNDTADAMVLHEYTHHFFFRSGVGAVPTWYSEGFAELYSTAEIEPDGGVVVGLPPLSRSWELANTRLHAISLLATPESWIGTYGNGWLLSHYLTFSAQRSGQLGKFLSEFANGIPSPTAAGAAFGDLRQLEGEVTRYMRQKQLPTVRIAPERIVIGPIALRTLPPEEARMMQVRIRLHGFGGKIDKGLDERARRDAAGTERNAAAQTILAEAELGAGNLDAAEAAADRAIADDPGSADALLVRAEAAMARAEKADKASARAAWAEARRQIVRANRADPNRPGPLAAYYRSFLKAHEAPTPVAVNGLRRAFQLAPEATALRVLLARQAFADRDYATARAALAPIAFASHRNKAAEAVTQLVARIDAGKTEGIGEAAEAVLTAKELAPAD